MVQKLISKGNYLNKGYHLFTNNFYTNLRLAKAQIKYNTLLTGTKRRTIKQAPLEAKTVNVGEIKYFACGKALMFSFKDKKIQPISRNIYLMELRC